MFLLVSTGIIHGSVVEYNSETLNVTFLGVLNISGSHLNNASSVLVFSTLGKSRCCAVAMAYLMTHLKYTIKVIFCRQKHVLNESILFNSVTVT